MSKRVLYLISFVLVLGLAGNALAEDLAVPDWAGAPGSTYAIWSFDADGEVPDTWFPEEYIGDEENHMGSDSVWTGEGATNPDFAALFNMSWSGAVWSDAFEGRQGVAGPFEEVIGIINNYPRDESRFKRIRIQVTYFTEGDPYDLFLECETADEGSWNYWQDWRWYDWMEVEYELEAWPVTDLGGGWHHVFFEIDMHEEGQQGFTLNPGAEAFFVGGADISIDQIIVDTICYEGDEPPSGPGRSGVDLGEDPVNGSIVDLDRTEPLSWVLPDANDIENGTVTCDVWFAIDDDYPEAGLYPGDPNFTNYATKIVGDPDPEEIEFVAIPVTLVKGHTYYWKIDTYDDSSSEPQPVEGPVFTFNTYNYVTITEQPEDVRVFPGERADFTVESPNVDPEDPADGYQWYKTDTPDGMGTPIEGETEATLVIDPVTVDDEGYYYCVAYNSFPSSEESMRAKLTLAGLIAHYKFEGDANDETGDYNGTAVNTTDYPEGIDGQAVNLDGISQYVALPAFGPLDQVSISVWVSVTEYGGWFDGDHVALLHTDGWDDRPGSIHALMFEDEVGFAMQDGPEPWGGHETPAGEWMHIVYTYEIDDGDGIARVYVNGELGEEAVGSDPEVLEYSLKLGAWLNPDDEVERHLNAKFDDVRIYNYPLSLLNVASLYVDFVEDASVCHDEDIYMDLDGSCQVDFADFAIFAAEWMECNQVPECDFELP